MLCSLRFSPETILLITFLSYLHHVDRLAYFVLQYEPIFQINLWCVKISENDYRLDIMLD